VNITILPGAGSLSMWFLSRPGQAIWRIVALVLGITAAELQARPGIPALLKKPGPPALNDVEV
jgi:hypothetical protein